LRTFNKDDIAFDTGIEGDIAWFSLAEKETLHDNR
jgi:hypothetical protein